ncbi:MAG: hypothetical protein RMN25_11215 [Anaerolineae bacterium]|nr:hypothetical protein [Thermoflexales bacterium]MDW8408338.1 hypothetical protein [Anaerolineae bacterium]
MRLLKVLTVLLAVTGVAALVLASQATARPVTLISSIAPSMNFAYVRVEGIVIDYPSLDSEREYLSFRLRDSGGEMRVAAYRSTVKALLNQSRLPMPGDQVIVEGTLRIRDDEPSLTLNVADALWLTTHEARLLDLAALDAAALGSRVTVAGQARRLRSVGDFLRVVTLRQGDAEADMLIPLSLQAVFGMPPEIAVGDWITVTGSVGEYRGRRQVLPARADHVFAIPARSNTVAHGFDLRPISAFNHDLVGHWVATAGQLTDIREIKQGALLEIEDETGNQISVVAFDAWFSWPFSQTVTAGDRLAVQGVLVDYKGKLEIQPQLPIDLLWLRNDE